MTNTNPENINSQILSLLQQLIVDTQQLIVDNQQIKADTQQLIVDTQEIKAELKTIRTQLDRIEGAVIITRDLVSIEKSVTPVPSKKWVSNSTKVPVRVG